MCLRTRPRPRRRSPGTGFHVDLGDLFEGPFDLLLGLIAKHKLDVTEVALSKVTDEFIAHIKALGSEWDLGQATEFLVVAATLLDLKAARLLPSGEVEDEEDLALLEARDLLFARLLQYRAYKQVAAVFAGRMADEAGRFPRAVTLEPQFAGLLPEVLLGLGPQEFAALAAAGAHPQGRADHRARPPARAARSASASRLRSWCCRCGGRAVCTFRALTADCEGTFVVVARFLALLELYREGAVAFEQVDAARRAARALDRQRRGRDRGHRRVRRWPTYATEPDDRWRPTPATDDVPLDDPTETSMTTRADDNIPDEVIDLEPADVGDATGTTTPTSTTRRRCAPRWRRS